MQLLVKCYDNISYEDIHQMAGRATPDQLMHYKLSLQLQKTINHRIPTTDWLNLNINIRISSRKTKFITRKTNRLKVGMNCLSNRLWLLNDKIEMGWLNLSNNYFKVKCKRLFL